MGAPGLTTDDALSARLERCESDPELAREDAPVEPPERKAGFSPGRIFERLPDELSELLVWTGHVTRNLGSALGQACVFVATSAAAYVRRHPVHTATNLGLAAAIGLLVATGIHLNQQLVTQRLTTATVDSLVEASSYTRSYSLTGLQERGDREFLRPGAPSWAQRESVQAILGAARKAGLSLEHQAVLLATAEIESGLNPMAQAVTTSACGVFQFIRETGEKFGLKDSDCLDPWLSAEAEIDHYIQNYQRRIESRVAKLEGPEKLLRMFELSFYLHHDGPLSSKPSAEVKAVVLAGTPFLFRAYETLRHEQNAHELEPSFMDWVRAERDAAVRSFVEMARLTFGSGAVFGEGEANAASLASNNIEGPTRP